VLFDALRNGDLDVYVDYTGTIWATIMKRTDRPGSREAVHAEVKRYLQDEHGIVLAASIGFENSYALAMRADHARHRGIETLSDLAEVSHELEIGGDYEFYSRLEWAALVEAYRFEFTRMTSMDGALMYQAVAAGDVDVISAFSTDGRIAAFDLRILRDDRSVIPPYDAIVLVGPRAARRRPELVESLARLEGVLDQAAMQRLNLSVDAGDRSPAEAAEEVLTALRREPSP
jgi:osmoprotectant transport system permease protein